MGIIDGASDGMLGMRGNSLGSHLHIRQLKSGEARSTEGGARSYVLPRIFYRSLCEGVMEKGEGRRKNGEFEVGEG